MKIRVLPGKELPQGQEAGEVLDVHEDVARALVLVGAVEIVEEPPAPKPAGRRYARRDLVPQD